MAKKSKYDIDAVRKKIADKKSSGAPEGEFRVPRLASGEVREYYFYILGPFQKGDAILSGAAPDSMQDNEFYVEHGFHFLGKKRRGCPRINFGDECCHCDKGFELLDDLPKSDENKDARSSVIREFLSRSSWAVNIYFPPLKKNPEDLRGKVKYYDANKTVNDIWHECLFKNDCGDEEDPEAFGIFYDEYDANLFKLKVTCSHQNDYKSSRFLAASKPIAVVKGTEDPDEGRIQDILAKRHNLLEIPAEVDLPYLKDQISKLFDEGDSSDDGFDEEEVDEEVETKPKKKKTTKKKAKPPEEELEEEEEEVEEKSKKKTTKKKGPSMTAPTTSKKKKKATKKKPADDDEEEEDGISGELPAEEEEEAPFDGKETKEAEEELEEAEDEAGEDEDEEEDDLESQVEDLLKDLGDDDEDY